MNIIQTLKTRLDEADLWQKELILKRKEILKRSGSKDSNLYYIESGSLRIYFEDDYQEHILRLGYQGNFIGALDSFISEKPSDLCIQAIKNCRLKKISKKAFMEFLQADSALSLLWQELLGQLIYQQMEREKDILISSPKVRFQRVLARSPQLFQEIPNKYIASYLRMTPETLSRLKKS